VAKVDNEVGSNMMIDDYTLKQLLRIDDELMQLCKWLNERHDLATSSKLIPLVDERSHPHSGRSRQEQAALKFCGKTS
jgi:hypothetical protein